MLTKRNLSKILSFILALCLVLTVPTYNAEAASKKVTLYVVSRITTSDNLDLQYTYNSNGLLIKRKNTSSLHQSMGTDIKLSYSGKKLVKVSGNTKQKLTFDKNGRLIKKRANVLYTYSYNKKGQLKRVEEPDGYVYREYQYDKKGRLITEKQDEEIFDEASMMMVRTGKKIVVSKISYNPKGYIKKIKKPQSNGNLTNSYSYKFNKNGLPTKIKIKGSSSVKVFKITYKAITVPKSYVNVIKEQRHYILQPALDPYGFYGFYGY